MNNLLPFQLDLAAQFVAVIFVLFVRRFRQPAWRPLRGFIFSFMASSAFYPIMYACYLHGYNQMDDEAGASRYALTVLVYVTAVTIYAVRETGVKKERSDCKGSFELTAYRFECRKHGGLDGLIYGGIRIRYSMCSWLWGLRFISRPLQRLSIIRINLNNVKSLIFRYV